MPDNEQMKTHSYCQSTTFGINLLVNLLRISVAVERQQVTHETPMAVILDCAFRICAVEWPLVS